MAADAPDGKTTKDRQRVLASLSVLLLFAMGFALGLLADRSLTGSAPQGSRGVQIRANDRGFVNPLLDCEISGNPTSFQELTPFHDRVEQLLQKRTADYKLSHVSVYFRDLNNGPWFGIHDREKFAPASLLKVPILIACLKEAELDPSFLTRRVPFFADRDLNELQNIRPATSMTRGASYSVDQLLRRMIVESDNNAEHLLFATVDQRLLDGVFRVLDIENPLDAKEEDFLTVAAYASLFRVLYNASYLSQELSVKALSTLAASDYRDGIVAGVPPTVVVAHKFGERTQGRKGEIKQLHDCGIVYYPGRPYLLCVMSRGSDFSTLDDVIRDVSRLVYEEVDRQSAQR